MPPPSLEALSISDSSTSPPLPSSPLPPSPLSPAPVSTSPTVPFSTVLSDIIYTNPKMPLDLANLPPNTSFPTRQLESHRPFAGTILSSFTNRIRFVIHSPTLGETATSNARSHLTSTKWDLPTSLDPSQFAILKMCRRQVDEEFGTMGNERVTEELVSNTLTSNVRLLLRQFDSFYGSSLEDLTFLPNHQTEGGEVRMDHSLFVGGTIRLEVECKAANALLETDALLWRLDDFVSTMKDGYMRGWAFNEENLSSDLVNLVHALVFSAIKKGVQWMLLTDGFMFRFLKLCKIDGEGGGGEPRFDLHVGSLNRFEPQSSFPPEHQRLANLSTSTGFLTMILAISLDCQFDEVEKECKEKSEGIEEMARSRTSQGSTKVPDQGGSGGEGASGGGNRYYTRSTKRGDLAPVPEAEDGTYASDVLECGNTAFRFEFADGERPSPVVYFKGLEEMKDWAQVPHEAEPEERVGRSATFPTSSISPTSLDSTPHPPLPVQLSGVAEQAGEMFSPALPQSGNTHSGSSLSSSDTHYSSSAPPSPPQGTPRPTSRHSSPRSTPSVSLFPSPSSTKNAVGKSPDRHTVPLPIHSSTVVNGSIVNSVVLDLQVGKGKTSAVYPTIPNQLVVKIARSNPEYRTWVRSEASILLLHLNRSHLRPFVIECFGYGESESHGRDSTATVLEDGGKCLEDWNELTKDDKLHLAIGLVLIHLAGVIHNDVYPRNAVKKEGQLPKWIDFTMANIKHSCEGLDCGELRRFMQDELELSAEDQEIVWDRARSIRGEGPRDVAF